MDSRANKGRGAAFRHAWISEHYGPEALLRIINALPEEYRYIATDPSRALWYPLSVIDEENRLFIAAHHADDPAEAESVLRQMGHGQAAEVLSSVYRRLLDWSTAELVFRQIPRMWSTFCKGTTCEVTKTGPRSGMVVSQGMECAYISPMIQGHLAYALESARARNVQVSERSWDNGEIASPVLIFDITWQ